MTMNIKRIADQMFAACDYCGQLVNRDSLATTCEGAQACEDCAEEMLCCDECGQLLPENVAEYVVNRYGDDSIVCPECLNNWYYYCDECGRYVHAWQWNNEFDCCEDCARDRYIICDYHAGHPNGLQLFGNSFLSYVPGYFGRELEIACDNPDRLAYNVREAAANADWLHFEHDCSVDGVEIIFQPMTMEYMQQHREDFERIFSAIRAAGGTAEEGNGLHVHVSREAFGSTAAEQARRIALCMKAFAGRNYERMRDAAGRDYDDARQWCRDNARIGSFADKKEAAARRYADRYLAVNINNDNTVEFRLGRSTTDCADFYLWTEAVAVIVRRSETITAAQAQDLDQWFAGAPQVIIDFLNGRNAQISEPLQPIESARYNEMLRTLAGTVARQAGMLTGASITECSARRVLENVCGMTAQEARAIFPQ